MVETMNFIFKAKFKNLAYKIDCNTNCCNNECTEYYKKSKANQKTNHIWSI